MEMIFVLISLGVAAKALLEAREARDRVDSLLKVIDTRNR